MLQFLPAPLVGAIMAVLLAVNTLFWCSLLYVIFVLKLFTPAKSTARALLSRLASWLAMNWASINSFFAGLCHRTRWDIRIGADLNPKGQYLVVSNHQTWNDIFVLMRTTGRRAPFFKFFIKQQLIWVPFLGLAWWGLDFPFMKRSTPDQIKKDPSLKGKDIETTKRACEKYHGQPVLILNFLEGTRFTRTKQVNQKAPYLHLLRPKAGGFAFAVEAMGENLHDLLDVTIAYPGGAVGFWDFLCGRMRHVVVDVRRLNMPAELLQGLVGGQYEGDSEFRKRFQLWLGELWREKDARIAGMLGAAAVTG